MKLIYLLPLGLFIIVAVFLGRGLNLHPTEVQSPLVGKPLPRFSLSLLSDEGEHITEKEFQNQVSVLNVWASWCVSCLAEHRYVKAFAKEAPVQFYGLNYKDNRVNAQQWLANYGNPYKKVAFDPDGEVAIDLGVYGTPESFLIDKKGIIRFKYVGVVGDRIWQQEFLPRIEELVG